MWSQIYGQFGQIQNANLSYLIPQLKGICFCFSKFKYYPRCLILANSLTKFPSKKVVISTRRGTWIFNRVIQWGMPYDVVYQTRFYDWLMKILPWSIANDFHEWRVQQRM